VHELSLVNGILQAVEETAKETGGSVRSFRVGVGELAQFDLRLVRQLLEDSRRGTPLQDADVTIEVEQSKVRCMSCRREWNFRQLSGHMSEEEKEMVHFLPELLNSFARCPSCSRSFFEIEQGRSVRLIEVVFDD
jgi:Zn finger protein HypA/HybF involved in hydrogenase expression